MSALMYIDDILVHDNLEAVQAILCCAIYSLRSPTGTSHWYGLHKDQGHNLMLMIIYLGNSLV